MKKKAAIDIPTDELKCEHCKKIFVKPGSLIKHLCEPLRRWQDREHPANRIAYMSWLKFYQQYQPRTKKKEHTDFIASPYYRGFVKYGTYCVDVSVINPLNFVDWLLKEKISLDKWTSDRHYGRYLVEYLRLEDSMDAVERSLVSMCKIADNDNLKLSDVLRFSNANKICHLIAGGHISPWVLFNSESGQYFLSELDQNQTAMIFDYINPDLWNIKFMRDKPSLTEVQNMLKQARI